MPMKKRCKNFIPAASIKATNTKPIKKGVPKSFSARIKPNVTAVIAMGLSSSFQFLASLPAVPSK